MADLVPATRLKAQIRGDRNVDSRSSPVIPLAYKFLECVVADGDNSGSFALSFNGRLYAFVVSAPNIPTDTTFDITILDEDGNQLHQTTGIAEDSIVRTDVSGSPVISEGNGTVVIDFTTLLSGDTAAFDVKLVFGSDMV